VAWDDVLFDQSSPEICEFLRVDILMCSSFEALFTSYWRGSCRLSIRTTATWGKAWWYNESLWAAELAEERGQRLSDSMFRGQNFPNHGT
jgi:hypothetical protein